MDDTCEAVTSLGHRVRVKMKRFCRV